MNALLALGFPVLVSAVVVFVISSLVHMAFKWHASDYGRFADEDAVRAALNARRPAPGRNVIPFCGDMKEMGSEAMRQKYREGPVGPITLGPVGVPVLGKFLGQWFVWTLVVAAVAGVAALRLQGAGAAHARGAAELAALVTLAAHGFGTVIESIWAMRPWSSSAKYLLDAALYAAGTYGVFLQLWP